MKSGKASNPNITQLTPIEATVLEHVANYGLTTRDVWQDGDLANTDIASVGAAARSLTRSGLLEVGNLYHGRHYFVLTHRGIDQVKHSTVRPGLLSEPDKIQSYAKLLLLCIFRTDLRTVLAAPLVKQFGEGLRGIASRFLLKRDEQPFLAFLRIDTRVQSRPSRAAQAIRGDILRFARHPNLALVMKRQRFEYLWITATQARADAVLAHFRTYARVGKSQFTIVVMPKLLPLLVGVQINKEMFIPRKQP